MASSYIHTTALKIYTAIAASGDRGLDIDQLTVDANLATNTIRTYARWLEEDGAIEIVGVHSDAPNRPVKNLYLAVRDPRPRITDKDRLKKIQEILMPFSKHPSSWDKAYKSEIVAAIQEAIKATAS